MPRCPNSAWDSGTQKWDGGYGTFLRVPPTKEKPDGRQFKVGDKIRVNLHHGKIEDAVVRAVIQDENVVKLQVDVVGLDLTALIDTRQVVE